MSLPRPTSPDTGGNRKRLAALALLIGVATGGLMSGIALGGSPPAAQDGGDLPAFERQVYAFEVADAGGDPYDHPFLGGFNIPRPQLVDIDGDGDLDLFVQEYSEEIMFFEQVGTPTEPRYLWRSDKFHDLSVGEWYHFADVDADGDYDLLAEERFSLIRLWRNTGGRTNPAFDLVTNKILDSRGEAIFSDRQNIPKIGDIDCDRRLDLMLGRLEGTITRYEVSGEDQNGAPRFRHVTDRFQDIEIIGQVLGGVPGTANGRGLEDGRSPGDGRGSRPSRHGANTMALEDIDGDGDPDLFWGDFFEPGLLFIENTGSCSTPSLRSEPEPFPIRDPVRTSGYNAPAFGDLDADGDNDLLIGVLGGAYNPNTTTMDNFLHLEQTRLGVFEVRTRRYVTSIDVGSESFPAFADTDGDGDLDLYLGNKIEPDDTQAGRLYYFENTGTATEPRLRYRGELAEFNYDYHFAPAFGDLDGDGDLDILMGSWRDDLRLVINEGSATEPRWTIADPAIVTLTRGRNATPALGDIDADGDLDLFIGESSGDLNFYRNVGTAQSPSFELVSDKYLEIDAGRRSVPTLADVDADGDLDLVLGSEADGLLFYRNNGSPAEPRFEAEDALDLDVQPFTTPTFADIDGDGDLDFFAGGIAGGLIFHENRGR